MTAAEQKMVDNLRARDKIKTAQAAALRQRLRRLRQKQRHEREIELQWACMTEDQQRQWVRARMSPRWGGR